MKQPMKVFSLFLVIAVLLCPAVYAEETALFKINTETGKISKLSLPDGADVLTDSRMASFNGSLFMLGGISSPSRDALEISAEATPLG